MKRHELIEFFIHQSVGDALEGVSDMDDPSRQELAQDIADTVKLDELDLRSVPDSEWDWEVSKSAVGMTIRQLIEDVIRTHHYKTALNEIDFVLANGGQINAL
jgi:hypothetical protein